MSNVAVVGGCGRLGFRLSLVLANKGHKVLIVDIDEEKINDTQKGSLPFIEEGAELYLEQALKNKTLTLSSDYNLISNSEVIVITIGTPVDSNLNPSLEPVAGVIFDLSEHFKQNQLIVFRNVLSPAILNRVKILLEDKTGFKVGKDIYLAFAPELTNENTNIHNLQNTPQPIGTYDESSFKAAKDFFQTITNGKISRLTPEEAVLSKLMTNMASYIQNACANEFYLIAETFGANYHKIVDAINTETSRSQSERASPTPWAGDQRPAARKASEPRPLRGRETRNNNSTLQLPNPNAAGPGMHKEGWFLVERTPFTELVTTAFKINESMPAQIVQKLENYKINKVVILGMTNKPNSDDSRSSLSYKLRKLLCYKNYSVGCYDPYLPEFSDSAPLHNADAVILMTPHKEFANLEHIMKLVNNPNCIYLDISGFWEGLKTRSHHAK